MFGKFGLWVVGDSPVLPSLGCNYWWIEERFRYARVSLRGCWGGPCDLKGRELWTPSSRDPPDWTTNPNKYLATRPSFPRYSELMYLVLSVEDEGRFSRSLIFRLSYAHRARRDRVFAYERSRFVARACTNTPSASSEFVWSEDQTWVSLASSPSILHLGSTSVEVSSFTRRVS